MAASELVFFVNGKKNVLQKPDPEMTLLQYLRTELQLTGTKLGCGEGGCGACTVMISVCPTGSNNVRHMSANACLLPVCALHGAAVTTVEGIGSLKTRLHPVQKRLAEAHGSQCGFCTPGFVTSMYSLLRNNPTPSLDDLETVFDGNLCRCTGYRPILEGYKPFTKGFCEKGENCCMNKAANGYEPALQNGDAAVNGVNGVNGAAENGIRENGSLENGDASNGCVYDPTQEPIFPPFLKMEGSRLHSQSLKFVGPRVTWYRPSCLSELLDIKRQHPDCKIVIGNTELGIETKFKKQLYPVLVAAGQVPELTSVQRLDSGIRLGASVTLATLDNTLKAAIAELPEEKTRVFKAFVEMLRWFGGHQIRNVAAFGGNVMTASPISDLNPLLLASGAILQLVKTDGTQRSVTMDDKFFKGYRKTAVLPSEVLVSITIPYSKKNEFFMGFKQAHRKEDDISIVNAGMRVGLDDQVRVTQLSLAFGGMAPTTVMAARTMQGLIGRKWNEELLHKACELLASDLPLAPGSPGGMVEYRRTLTVSFFFKFYLTVLSRLQEQGAAVDTPVKASEQTAVEGLERQAVEGFQWYEVNRDDLSPHSALRLPIVHESAYRQTTGEAVYVNDIAPKQGELYMGLVMSTKAHARITRVDPSPALAMAGVVDFVSHKDIPGKNQWGLKNDEQVFAVDKVVCQGQPIGAIVAESQVLAQRAAQAVAVKYEELEPIITIAEAIAKDSLYPHNPSMTSGDVEGAMSRAQHVLEGEVHVEAQEHFYLEPHAAIAYPGEDGHFEMVATTQTLMEHQRFLAGVLGVPSNKIKTSVRRLGGGFGGKETRGGAFMMPLAVAAVKLGRPVRCALERDEDMMLTGTRHPVLGKYKVGFSSDGKIQALDQMFYTNAGCSIDLSYPVMEKIVIDCDGPYMIPNRRVSARACKTNLPSSTAFRGFGGPQSVVVAETIITEVASYLNMPPEKVRELNMYKEGDVTHYKQVVEQCNLQRCWAEVLQQSQFDKKRREVDLFNTKNRWRKRGLAVVPCKFGLNFYEKFLCQGAALVNIYRDGTVLVSHGGVEMGQGLHTKILQVASQVLQLPLSKIAVNITSTDMVPNTSPSAASVSSDLVGAAVVNACETLLQRLKPIKAAHPKATWEELLRSLSGTRYPIGNRVSESSLSYEKINEAYLERVSLSATGHYKTPDCGYDFCTNTGGTRPHNYFSFSAACTEVEIDCLTGDHQVLSTDIVFDVGKSLNPAIDVGQIEGGFIQGYGLMVLEQYKVQADGTLLTRGPGSYKIPTAGNSPQKFNVSLLRETGNPRAIYSSKAIGEPPLLLAVSVLCALRDAISAARQEEGLGADFRLDTPATPARIRMACSDAFTKMFEGQDKNSKAKPWFVDL